MKRQLQKAFGIVIAQKTKLMPCMKARILYHQVLNGDILLLPNNLYIWATMRHKRPEFVPNRLCFQSVAGIGHLYAISNAEKDWIIEKV